MREARRVVVVIVVEDCFSSVVLVVDLIATDDVSQVSIGSADEVLWLD